VGAWFNYLSRFPFKVPVACVKEEDFALKILGNNCSEFGEDGRGPNKVSG
jgi:hypothetical protein